MLDFLNLAFRAKHTVFKADTDMKIGLAMHTMLNSIRMVNRRFEGDHVVVCMEGKSWRKKADPTYKANRLVKQLQKSVREQEDDEIFLDGMNEFAAFLVERTNATVLQCPVAEADDMIAIWIDMHPDDEHVIISSDSDFYQLLSPSVEIYNGVSEEHITLEGFFKNGKPVIDKKTQKPKEAPDPEYLLFEKCIRGDTTDNIFSAFPGVRKKGTKKQIGILDAFADREAKGFTWNNFMLQKWLDHEGNEQRVLDRYLANKHLIDLHEQPDDIKLACIESVREAIQQERVSHVGVHFLKFCALWDLKRISQYPEDFAKILNTKYEGTSWLS